MQQRWWGALIHQRRGEEQGADLHVNFQEKKRLERQKGLQWVDDKLLLEIGQIVVHKAHLLSQ
jgi:hypothetical protein